MNSSLEQKKYFFGTMSELWMVMFAFWLDNFCKCSQNFRLCGFYMSRSTVLTVQVPRQLVLSGEIIILRNALR